MGRLESVILATLFASLPVTAIAQTVKAPRGWQEHTDGNVRVVEKGNSRIEIESWTDLNGQSLEDYMKANEHRVQVGAVFKSSKGVKAERIEGAYAATRSVTRNGRTGTSILYGCSGAPGTGRLMMLTTDTSNFGDLVTGGFFIEKICKSEPKGKSVSQVSGKTSPVPKSTPRQSPKKPDVPKTYKTVDLAKENARIPTANRPVSVTTVLETSWRGFPAMRISEARMMMTFPNGYSTFCSNWDLVNQSPTPNSIGRRKDSCELTKGAQDKGDIKGFKPGQTIDLVVGNVGGHGFDLGGSSSSVISGGDLVMTKDGRIAIGSFSAYSVSSAGNGVGGHTHPRKVFGRYYLDGYTITIQTNEGDILHSFFGVASNSGSRVIDHAFLGGEHYWTRD